METVNEDELRKLSYSELRKRAKDLGIKANMKADKLVSVILSASMNCSSSKEESFVINQEITSPSKIIEGKEKQLNSETKNTSLSSVRKFSLEGPVFPQIIDVQGATAEKSISSTNNTDVKTAALKSASRKSVGHVMKSAKRRTSGKRKSKVSFITPAKKSLPSSVNNSGTSYASVKNRPKTPAANKVITSGRRPSTRRSTAAENAIVKTPESAKLPSSSKTRTPRVTPFKLKPSDKQKLVFDDDDDDNENCEKSSSKNAKKEQETQTMTPVATPAKSQLKTESTRVITPNFKKIHQKAFDKMESIDEYHQRMVSASAGKKRNAVKANHVSEIVAPSAKKARNNSAVVSSSGKKSKPALKRRSLRKIPKVFSGVPFIPTVTSVSKIKTNFASATPNPSSSSLKSKRNLFKTDSNVVKTVSFKDCIKENKVRKTKFDLAASLAKKLPYKPYTGPVKPLSATTANKKIEECQHNKNPGVEKHRKITRNVLHGVRKNKRFQLQMNRRGFAE